MIKVNANNIPQQMKTDPFSTKILLFFEIKIKMILKKIKSENLNN